ncbi:hypothetical protein Anas_14158 [Armadillidium nasatum]|uniref:Uncharacterized protein n=1 Tax=Armadillidium nasatum TaxID=96803 RepID=A0A5N5SP89_9CRUS|nr:hypothetical protein Anas_14158 [Armadillidium nasatum]
MGDCQVLAAFFLTPKATFRGLNIALFCINVIFSGCYGDTCRRLQVKLLHFNATNQVSSSNLDEEE